MKLFWLAICFWAMALAVLAVGALAAAFMREKDGRKNDGGRSDPNIDLSEEELGLICRALSDSMNYNADDRKAEKWELLLKCKDYQLRLENKMKKE